MPLARHEFTVVDEHGDIVTDAQVEVRREVAGQPLASIYSDRDGATPLGNPFNVDSQTAVAAFHVIGGAYKVRAFKTGFERIARYVAIGTAGESDEAIQFPGLTLLWDTGTADADPGAGNIRANNASLSAATVLYCSKTNVGGSDIGARLLELGDTGKASKDRIILTRSDQAQASFTVTSVAEGDDSPPSYVKITVSGHAGETSFGVGEALSLQAFISGEDGAITGPASSVAGQIAAFTDTSATDIAGADLGDSPPTAIIVGTVSGVRASTPGHALHAGHLEDAAAVVTLTDAATIALDWSSGINFIVTLTADRILGNPTNEIAGQWRTVLVKGNATSPASANTLTFGIEYGGDIPTVDNVTDTQFTFLMIYCKAAGQFLVSAINGSDA